MWPNGAMHHSLHQQDHRPWALPSARWTWRQSWCDLLFAHWRVPVEQLRPYIPEPLEIDTYEDEAYVAIVPFRMHDVALRPFPPVPGTASFPEINVRTYVRYGAKPGVWFLSLDASNPLAVWAARTFFHLPYFGAHMQMKVTSESNVSFETARKWSRHHPQGTPGCEFAGSYRPTSAPRKAQPGSLEHFLTERYCLYAAPTGGGLHCLDVHHIPWPLCDAEANIQTDTMLAPWAISPYGEPIFHFAKRVDVVTWPAKVVDRHALPPRRHGLTR